LKTKTPSELAVDFTVAVERRANGRQMRWVMVSDVAARLGLDDDAAEAGARQAIANGWLISEGDPPHSVCLASSGI